MRYPEFLKDGGKIGFIAPSFSCMTQPYRDRYTSALSTFRRLGFEISEGPNTHRCDGIGKSSSARNCADEINTYFTQPESDIVISCGGGETMCEDLSFVDFQKISDSQPKWFLGYSDNTNLTFTLTTLCDTASVYTVCAQDFGMVPWHESINDAFDFVMGRKTVFENYPKWELEEDPLEVSILAPYYTTMPFELRLFEKKKNSCEGRLLGGCLDCLVTLCGTRFDKVRDFNRRYEKDGVLWFLESCDLSPIGVRRALWQLENAGWFDNARGFLIGRPGDLTQNMMGMDRYDAITGVLGRHNVPIIMDLDLGHHSPVMPFVTGSYAKATAKDNHFTLETRLI